MPHCWGAEADWTPLTCHQLLPSWFWRHFPHPKAELTHREPWVGKHGMSVLTCSISRSPLATLPELSPRWDSSGPGVSNLTAVVCFTFCLKRKPSPDHCQEEIWGSHPLGSPGRVFAPCSLQSQNRTVTASVHPSELFASLLRAESSQKSLMKA